MKSHSKERSQDEGPNLRSLYDELLGTVELCEQHEELLDTVRTCERKARVQDLIDAHIRFEQLWRKGFERPQGGYGGASQE